MLNDKDIIIKKEDINYISHELGEGCTIGCNQIFLTDIKNQIYTQIYKVPEKYIINERATILFWNDGTKTVIKRTKNDKYNKKLAFLIAYFQKNSGLSKTQANKYLDSLKDENELKFLKLYEEK